MQDSMEVRAKTAVKQKYLGVVLFQKQVIQSSRILCPTMHGANAVLLSVKF